MTVQVQKRDGESAEKLLKRFSGHIKSLRLIQKFRKLRYNRQSPRKIDIRQSAIVRERHRTENKRKRFFSS